MNLHLANSNLKDPEFYVPGLPVDWVTARYGIPADEVAKLGSAENPFGPSPKAMAAIREEVEQIHLYSSWTAEPLREALAERYGYNSENFVCGSGETEVIALVIRAFAEPGGKVLMTRPCFPMYHLFAEAEDRRPAYIDTPTMSCDVDAYIDAVEPDTRIVFITNPHSPSGTWLEEAEIRRIVEAAPHALVVLDEAYVHYSDTPGHIHLAKEYDNLIVLRTFSKAFGLAGLRLGFGVAHPDLIPPLLAVKPTWNVGRLQIVGGIAALTDDEHVDRTVAAILESRFHVNERFGELDRFRLVPGTRSNFMLIEILDSDTNSTKVFNGLLERGVIVKDGSLSFRGLGKRYLRSDINLPHRMDRLVDALADLP
ncbi:MAG: histidinol-phosphate transaminase [Actinomycetota bacterium]|nr:histidinol-phosphate transaminase [Actinomycetota bacterium]MEE3212210.1 histidinol-phosphate transaminase [Actinomycetota bacterium]MEE3251329.1 histidinol-phosphate transaminase [Actinomycetota bacterium]MEE3276021.1 histidinol-phosphate transaminase [Actinomycetota bacterium]